MKTLDYILLTLVIIGAINWGLIGFLQFDLVRVLFGDMSLLSRIIYAAVGIGGLYAISYYGRYPFPVIIWGKAITIVLCWQKSLCCGCKMLSIL